MSSETTQPPVEWRAYSPGEAAEVLGVPVGQIRSALSRGDLEHVRIGRHYRISDSALRRFAGQDPAVA